MDCSSLEFGFVHERAELLVSYSSLVLRLYTVVCCHCEGFRLAIESCGIGAWLGSLFWPNSYINWLIELVSIVVVASFHSPFSYQVLWR